MAKCKIEEGIQLSNQGKRTRKERTSCASLRHDGWRRLASIFAMFLLTFHAAVGLAQDDDDGTDRGPSAADAAGEKRYTVKTDLVYGKHEAQKLDIYAPLKAQKAPVMVYVHGGGWQRGDKRMIVQRVTCFTDRGWIQVSVNYRLGDDGKHPVNVQDVAAAVAWVHREIAKYGGDADKIFLMGHSAGCHLVSLLATDERRLKAVGLPLTAIKGVIALDTQAYDIVALMEKRPSELYRAAFGVDPAGQRDASPIHHVAKGKGIPPFLIFYSRGGGKQVNPGRQRAAEAFQAALREAGVQAEVVDASDRDHGEINRRFGDPSDEKVTVQAMAFLTKLARGDGPAPRP
jgi:acetyl esterase/lipase